MESLEDLKGPWAKEDFYLFEGGFEGLLQFFPVYDDTYLLAYVLSGTITVRIDGQEKVYSKDSFGSFTPKSYIELKAISEDFKIMGFSFQKDFILEIHEGIFYLNSFRLLQYRGITYLNLEGEKNQVVYEMFKTFEERVKQLKGNFYRGRCRALIVIFLYELEYLLQEVFALEDNGLLTANERLYYDFEILLYRDFTKHRKVAYYADLLGLPAAKLSMIVREVMGRNTKDIIDGVVVSQAKAWLKSGYYNISEVGLMLSYNNVEEFTRFFKLKVGMTPSKYIKLEK